MAVIRQSQRSVPTTGGRLEKTKCAERARICPGGTSGRAMAGASPITGQASTGVASAGQSRSRSASVRSRSR